MNPAKVHSQRQAPVHRGSSRSGRKGGAGGTLIGVFVGVVIGLAIAAAVAFFLMRSSSSFKSPTPPTSREGPRDAGGKNAKGESSAGPAKPRFDFYKILPGTEEPKVQPKAPDAPSVERPAADAGAGEKPAAPDAKPVDRFWLQAGSFSTQGDAENLKARLALSGWEATIQEATIPDRGVRYRVRLGPYENTEELNRTKNELGRRGFDVAVIKY